ncbi:hypothetical protein DFH06DRAFT_598683 [Mycena polygramma]|nr:hypothetical protein DFH06DRAFT_598683 [Mycena polygramma]
MDSYWCRRCGAGDDHFPSDDFSATPRAGTRHSALLNSNEAPFDSDISFVQSALEKTDARLAFLDAEMTRLRKRLPQLEEEHAALLSYRSKTNAILSPLRRMPPEVLSEIFCWTLPPARNVGLHPRVGVSHSPWVLTHISSRWRAIALSNPSLWSLVAIVYTADTDPSLYSLPMVETQVARAQKLKIHFYEV